MKEKPSIYGTHRVISPQGVLPQAALKIDNTMTCYDNEIKVSVSRLNIDSASFTQIKSVCHSDADKMETMILQIVNDRGKMQNPVTGSGGMFLGRVKEIGKDLNIDLAIGDEIASLVSLSLTPLKIHRILHIDMAKDQVEVEAEAILFESGIYAKIPLDIPANIALSALDVAGAPAQTNHLVKENDTVLVIGASGKSGLLCSYQAKKNAGKDGKVIALVYDEAELEDLKKLNVVDHYIIADARQPLGIYHQIDQLTNHQLVDVCINVVNVENTEMTSILTTKDTGIVYFFSMATSFTKAALGAEGIKKECKMIIGNGYTKGHDELTLNLLRESPILYEIFSARYGKDS